MNSQIRKIARDCGLSISQAYSAEFNKFAEMIVRECIDIVGVGGEFASRPKLVEKLKEHFGVEE